MNRDVESGQVLSLLF